jgi:hypothetical protein
MLSLHFFSMAQRSINSIDGSKQPTPYPMGWWLPVTHYAPVACPQLLGTQRLPHTACAALEWGAQGLQWSYVTSLLHGLFKNLNK